MKQDERVFAATAVAPLVFPLYLASAQFLDGDWPAFSIFAPAVVFAYAGTLLVGIPSVLILRRLDQLTLVPVCVAGAVGGLFVGTTYLAFVTRLSGFSATIEDILRGAPLMAGFGLAIAFVWCLISGVHNNLAAKR